MIRRRFRRHIDPDCPILDLPPPTPDIQNHSPTRWRKNSNRPSRIVLAAALSFIRDLVHCTFGVPAISCALLPDRWNNLRAARDIRVPALVLDGQDDRSDPICVGAAIFGAMAEHRQMAKLHGFRRRVGYMPEG
jgi:hypothetical protein